MADAYLRAQNHNSSIRLRVRVRTAMVAVRVVLVLDRVIVWLVRARARFYVEGAAYRLVVVNRRTSFQVLESVYRISSMFLKLLGQTPLHPCLASPDLTPPLSFLIADR